MDTGTFMYDNYNFFNWGIYIPSKNNIYQDLM